MVFMDGGIPQTATTFVFRTHQVGCITYNRTGQTPNPFVCTAKWQSMGVASPFFPAGLQEHHQRAGLSELYFETSTMSFLSWRRKWGSESYTLIQPHPHFPNTGFGVLVNSFHGYTRPLNAFMKEYIFLGIIPAYAARRRSIQGFKSNGHKIQFRNCNANPNSYFAFMPNHNRQTPSNYGASWHIFETSRVAVDWRSKAISIPVRTMPNEFFFLTELHFGGCGSYTSSNRWRKFGFHSTAIGIR